MERDPSYDELITPDPKLGRVVVLANPEAEEYKGKDGITAESRGVATFDPLDGPIRLENWALGNGIAYDGDRHSTPEDDPTAQYLTGESLVGTLRDGRLVFTGPIVETRYAGITKYAQACDGLLFELGEPNPEWLAVNYNPATAVADFMQQYAPLGLVPDEAPLSKRGLQ